MAIMRQQLGQSQAFFQAGGAVASTASNYFLPGSGPIVSGITSLFSSLFGGGPTRHQKSDAAIEAAKKYMPRDLPDLIRRIEQYIASTDKCRAPRFGGAQSTGQEGRAQYVAACLTAMTTGLKGELRICPPYDPEWCPHIKRIREHFQTILPGLKEGKIPGATPEQTAAIQNIAPLSGLSTSGFVPLLLLGGGIYLLTRR